MTYRPEIDGLRALAVVPVIFFHAGFDLFEGGFVGVDVFFVISGYLITKIIIEDIEHKRFSIINFYERRVRRILPTLFFVMLVCIPFAWMWMLPDALENFGQSLVAATLSANNILLFLTSGYWSLAAEFKPLLHTWSLGIEEQYYIFFPLFLILTWRLGKNIVLAFIIFLLVTSLALAEWVSRDNPGAAFFLIHTRAWEIFSGSIAAFIVQKKRVQKNNGLALVGLLAVIASIFSFGEGTRIPSVYTLLPVTGVVLIILYAEKNTFITKLLGNKAFVGIGLISYSAYLWHQPLFAFAKIYGKTEPSFSLNIILIILTFVLSYFSWMYIEKPFRNQSIIGRKALFSFVIASALFLIGFGYSLHKSHGFISRAFDESVSASDMSISYSQRNLVFKVDNFQTNSKAKVLVVGNSFGLDFINVIRETYDVSKFELIYRDDYDTCTLFKKKKGEILASQSHIIIFASNYDIINLSCINHSLEYAKEANSHIFFIGTKHFGFNQNWIARLDLNERKFLRNRAMLHAIKADIRASEVIPSENYISIMQPLTTKQGVLVTDELGRLISPDRTHLTKYGAIFIGREIVVPSALNRFLEILQNK